MTAKEYKLEELAKAAGMTGRTVRYYVQRGLLAAPAFRGKDTAYSHEHLVRLRAIKRMQEAYYPLDEIAITLASRSVAEIERLAESVKAPTFAADIPAADAAPARGVARRRIELLPGVELTVAEDAPAESVRHVEHLLEILNAIARTTSNVNEGGRKR